MRTKTRYEICVFPSKWGTDSDKIGENYARGRDAMLVELKRLTREHPDTYIIVRQSYWDRLHNRWSYRVIHNLTHDADRAASVNRYLIYDRLEGRWMHIGYDTKASALRAASKMAQAINDKTRYEVIDQEANPPAVYRLIRDI